MILNQGHEINTVKGWSPRSHRSQLHASAQKVKNQHRPSDCATDTRVQHPATTAATTPGGQLPSVLENPLYSQLQNVLFCSQPSDRTVLAGTLIQSQRQVGATLPELIALFNNYGK